MAPDILTLFERQKQFFQSGATRSYRFRAEQLKLLKRAITKYESKINDALYADLGKAVQESYMTEIGPALAEIRFIKNHLREWMQPLKVPGMIYSFHSSGVIYPEPYGIALIISPWNYPFWLSVNPVAGAIAAGNCVMVKPSELSPHSSAVLKEMVNDTFPDEYIEVAEGGPEISRQLTAFPPDYIFFTGSTAIGKMVAAAAAKNLVPHTLELGGKSPCIVDESADLRLAAKRIVWGKLIAAGQTCVAPDYLLVHKNVKDRLLNEVKSALQKFYPAGALKDKDYPHIINQNHFERLKNLLDHDKILFGGNYDKERLKIEPTILTEVSMNDRIMKEEIFGPLLPVLEFNSASEAIRVVNSFPKPLSLYIFSSHKTFIRKIVDEISYGGASVNDTIEHLGNPYLPFGGVGSSGIGAYHGKYSFDTFTHFKGVMKKSTWLDLPFRYKPFTKAKMKVLKMFLR